MTNLSILLADANSLTDCSDDDITKILTVVGKEYVTRLQNGSQFPAATTELTATDVVILCRQLLEVQDLEIFELGMWAALGKPE